VDFKRLNLDTGFYRLCASYDSISLAIVASIKGIDKGEAEAYAQYLQVQANFIISDDREFVTQIKNYTLLLK